MSLDRLLSLLEDRPVVEWGVSAHSWGLRHSDGARREEAIKMVFCIYKRHGQVRGNCSPKGTVEYWVSGNSNGEGLAAFYMVPYPPS